MTRKLILPVWWLDVFNAFAFFVMKIYVNPTIAGILRYCGCRVRKSCGGHRRFCLIHEFPISELVQAQGGGLATVAHVFLTIIL